MRRTALKKKHIPIDKSVLPFGCKRPKGKVDKLVLAIKAVIRFLCPAYLKSYDGATCIACGICDGTIVGAHIRSGWLGIGSKPHDYWTLPLCFECHALQGNIGEKRFWMESKGWTIKQAKEVARQRYEAWTYG